MPYFFVIAAGGAAISAGVAATRGLTRQRSLADDLTAPPEAEVPLNWMGRLQARIARADAAYQQAVRERIDPWLTGRARYSQLLEMSGGIEPEQSPFEKKINRQLVLGAACLGLLALAPYTLLPLRTVVLGAGLYISWPYFGEAFRIAIKDRRVSVLQLMMLYFAALWFGGHYLVGLIGATLTGFAQKIEILSDTAARQGLIYVFGRQPRKVWVEADGVELEIPFEELRVGDILVVDAGQAIAADGVVVQGIAAVDQRMLTGESQPAEKEVGDLVLASTVVLGGRIRVKVTQAGNETAAAKIGEILNRTVERQERVQTRQFQVADRTFWPMLAAGAAGWAFVGPGVGLALFGCNFVINVIPLRLMAMLNFLNTSSHRGILVKDGQALDKLAAVDTLVFDKTGTLTLDQPQVAQIHSASDLDADDLLALAAAAEQRQSHPIARAILAEAAKRGLALQNFEEANYRVGYGIDVQLDGLRVRVGSHRYMALEGMPLSDGLQGLLESCQALAHSLVFVAVDDTVAGAIELKAGLRPEAQSVVDGFKRQGFGLYIISGDQEAPTRALAGQLGMSGYFANTLPERKADLVAQLQKEGRKVCFIGDGINDAVALRQADVSISLRGAATAATDTAQIVLMDDHLEQLGMLFTLVKSFHGNIEVNLRLAVGASLLAAGGVLALPAIKFWVVELLAASQFAVGIAISNRMPKADGGVAPEIGLTAILPPAGGAGAHSEGTLEP